VERIQKHHHALALGTPADLGDHVGRRGATEAKVMTEDDARTLVALVEQFGGRWR
jgi:hypothetical protein